MKMKALQGLIKKEVTSTEPQIRQEMVGSDLFVGKTRSERKLQENIRKGKILGDVEGTNLKT